MRIQARGGGHVHQAIQGKKIDLAANQIANAGLGTALDNLNRAHALGLVQNPDAWLAMRLLRNRLVHEYVDDLSELNAALEQARALVQELHAAYLAIKSRSSILQS